MDFGNILTRAWRITWNNKVLWLFGFLAALGQGGGGGGGGSSRWSQRVQPPGGPGGPGTVPDGTDIQRWVEQVPVWVWVALICLGLLIALALIVVSIIGKGGLIGGVQIAETEGRVNFSQAWAEGIANFGRIFLIGLVVGLVVLALFLVTLVPGAVLTALTFGLGALCLIPLICVLAVVAVALNVVGNLAQIAAVVDRLSVGEALGKAWTVITANLGNVIVLGIILFIVSAIAGFLVALPIFAIVLPAAAGVVFGAAAESQGLAITSLVLGGLCFIAYLPVLFVFQGIVTTWTTSAWTLAYRRLTGRDAAVVIEPVVA